MMDLIDRVWCWLRGGHRYQLRQPVNAKNRARYECTRCPATKGV